MMGRSFVNHVEAPIIPTTDPAREEARAKAERKRGIVAEEGDLPHGHGRTP